MPKKFTGENTKAIAAKEKKQKVKEETVIKKSQEVEEEKWKDVSKLLEKKLKKKEEEEKRRQEYLNKKAELKDFLKKETESITKKKMQALPKPLTRAQINSNIKMEKPATKDKTEINKNETQLTASLTENLNRLSVREETARTINQAIEILNNHKKAEDRHPEKRLKAAHKAFEEKRLKELKTSNPTLKLSQLKQIVFKEWQKMQAGSA